VDEGGSDCGNRMADEIVIENASGMVAVVGVVVVVVAAVVAGAGAGAGAAVLVASRAHFHQLQGAPGASKPPGFVVHVQPTPGCWGSEAQSPAGGSARSGRTPFQTEALRNASLALCSSSLVLWCGSLASAVLAVALSPSPFSAAEI